VNTETLYDIALDELIGVLFFMKSKIKLGILIVIALVFFGILSVNLFDFLNNEQELTEQDNYEIINVVNQYYYSIIRKDFYEALQFCDLKNNNIDLETRVIVLQEISENIIEKFDFEYEATKVDKYKQDNKNVYGVKVTINLKYKDTLGGYVGEIVYVKKLNDEWKIQKIYGLDRFGFYRVGEYQYDRLIDFLNPKLDL